MGIMSNFIQTFKSLFLENISNNRLIQVDANKIVFALK